MGVRLVSQATPPVASSVAINTNVETTVLTLPPVNLALAFQQLLLFWWLTFTAGTGTIAVTVFLRRVSSAGNVAVNRNASTSTVVAGNTLALSGCYADVPGDVAGQTYILTVTQTGATANGTFLDGAIIALGM